MYHIALITDSDYVMTTSVCVQSIVMHTVDVEVIVHICTLGLSDSESRMLENLSSDKVQVKIEHFDEADFQDRFGLVRQKTHVTPTALLKFELPFYFEDLNELLYLDGDLVVKDSLVDLLNIELGNNLLACSWELMPYFNFKRDHFGRSKKDFYFNSGVMLMNLRMMREDRIADLLWDTKLSCSTSILMDQDVFNTVCGSRTIHLPLKWNYRTLFHGKQYIALINEVTGTNYKTSDEIEQDVAIIHYAGETLKPWHYKTAPLRRYWDEAFVALYHKDYTDYPVLEYKKKPLLARYRQILKDKGALCLLSQILYGVYSKLKY